jgi:hypothetical protein
VWVGGAACEAALAILFVATSPLASVHGFSVARLAAAPVASPGHPVLTPFRHPAPSGLQPFFAPAGTASPWTPLVNPPPFGTPGTMLLESDGTVLVHDEPDNNVTGGTNMWWKLTPDSNGSYIDGTWSQIASMPADYMPLYFASAILLGLNSCVLPTAHVSTVSSCGDAASDVLDNGTFMMQQACNNCLTLGFPNSGSSALIAGVEAGFRRD